MHRLLFIITAFLLSNAAFAQKGNVIVEKDPRLDELVKKQGTPSLPSTTPTINGYRLQLFFDTERKAVDKAKIKFGATHTIHEAEK
mgnify:CR=1 FL=1